MSIQLMGWPGRACMLGCTAALLLAASAKATTYANFNRVTYQYYSTLSTSQEASRYQVMLLQQTDAAMVPKLKAANPNLRIFVYQGIMAAQNTNPAYVTCTSGPWVVANHPNWILKDQYGHLILYQNHYLIDVGNTSYQKTCLANAIAMAKKDHFDGVYWDMVNSKLSWTLPSGTSVPEYPTDASWQAAMYSMLSYSGVQLHANALKNVGNLGGAFLFPGLWQKWNGPLDGSEDEGFTDNKHGTAAMLYAWPAQLAQVSWDEANHRLAILHSWNTTQIGNRYGLATMLLAANGLSSWSTSNGCYSTCEVWYPEYTTAQQLGAPVGGYARLSNGVYKRWYQKGLVLVNPSTNSISSFSLGGGTYSGSGLSRASSVSMGATTGYILLGDTGNLNIAPLNTGAPTISGSASVGQRLTAGTGTWTGTPTPLYFYQWRRCTSTTCTAIGGATASAYTLQSADAGYYVQVTVTAANPAGSSSASSAKTAQVH